MRYLGIDYGSKKVGLALSDEGGAMGFPHAVVPTHEALSTIIQLISDRQVGALVLGESRTLSGEENPIMHEIRVFATALHDATGLPVFFEPEVFTTQEAKRPPHTAAKSRALRDRAPVDASAAALILTSYLNHHGG
jgi:putative Holliday junction resolvase